MAKATKTKAQAKKSVAKTSVKKAPAKKAAKAVKQTMPETCFAPVVFLPDAARLSVIDVLQPLLCDTLHVGLQAKMAHWNVRGPNFIALHELFDKTYDQLQEYADLIAERIGQLGEIALGNLEDIYEISEMPTLVESKPYVSDKDMAGWEALTFRMAYALAELARRVGEATAHADDCDDDVTEDILTQIRRGLDKQAWFIENHTRSIGSV